MKKVISVLLALVLVFGAALPVFAASGDIDSDFGVAKGYVRAKEVYKTAGGEVFQTTRSFDKQGKILKEVRSFRSSDLSSSVVTTYVYNKKGLLTKETEVSNFSDGSSDKTVVLYTYDKNGNVIREEYQMGEYSHTFERTYDKKGNLTKEINYFNNGIDVTTYAYNSKGKVTKRVSRTDYEDNTWNKTVDTYTFDKNGNQTKEVYVLTDSDGGSEKQTFTDVYNAKGQHIKRTAVYLFDNNVDYKSSTRRVTTYAYAGNGKVSKEVEKVSYDGGPIEKTTTAYAYDSKGNLTKMVIAEMVGGGASKSTTAYAYDSKGNLTKEVSVYTDMDGTSKTTDAYAYDKAGNLLKHVHTYTYPGSDTEKDVTTYAYQKISK